MVIIIIIVHKRVFMSLLYHTGGHTDLTCHLSANIWLYRNLIVWEKISQSKWFCNYINGNIWEGFSDICPTSATYATCVLV